jgi:hypothetical protein
VATDGASVASLGTATLALLQALLARYGVKFVRAIITDHFFVSQPRA